MTLCTILALSLMMRAFGGPLLLSCGPVAPPLLTAQRLPVSRFDELVKEPDKMIKGENESEKLDEVRRARAPWCT